MAAVSHFEGWDLRPDASAATRGGGGTTDQWLNRKLIDSINTAGQTYSTTVVHHAHPGSASLRITNPAAASSWIREFNGVWAEAVGHLAFRCDTLPNNDQALMRFSDNSATQVGHDIQLRTTGAMRISIGGQNGPDAGTITTGVWYILEAVVTTTTTTHGITWKVYPAGNPGSPVVAERLDTKTGLTNTTVFSTRVGLGSVAVTSLDLYLDDWLVSEVGSQYPFGESIVKAYAPTGKGTHLDGGNFQNFAGAVVTNASPQNSHLDVDDVPSNTATGVQQVSNSATSYLEYAMASATETGTPLAVKLAGTFFPAGTAVSNMDMVLRQGGANSASMSFDPSVAASLMEWHTSHFTTKPTGGLWTSAALQATTVRVGFSTATANPPKLADLYLTACFPLSSSLDVVGGSVASTLVAGGGTATGTGTAAVTGGSVPSGIHANGGVAFSGGGGTAVSAPTLTAVDSGTLEILCGVADGANPFTPNTGWTEKVDLAQNMSTTANDQSIFVAYRVVDAGATGAALGTLTTVAAWSAMNILITPVPIVLVVIAPADNIDIGGHSGDQYEVTGTAQGPVTPTVTVNGITSPLDGSGNFSTLVTVLEGANPIVVAATESGGAGRTVIVTRTITVTPPGSGSGGGSSDPVPLSGDMLRIRKIIQESSLDPR